MASGRVSSTLALATAALTLLIATAAQAAPLYSVSLTASAKKVPLSIQEVPPPYGCIGHGESISTGFISANISAKPAKQGEALRGGTLEFGGKFSNLKGEERAESKGSFTDDPSDSRPESSSRCAQEFTPITFAKKCKKFTGAALDNGAPFALAKVKGGKLGLEFREGDVAIECDADNLGGTFLSEPVPTALKLSKVSGLRVGGSASASGKTVFKSGPSGVDVTTTMTYSVKVTRKK